MNVTQIGIVFGVFELVMFIFAPILGKYVRLLYSNTHLPRIILPDVRYWIEVYVHSWSVHHSWNIDSIRVRKGFFIFLNVSDGRVLFSFLYLLDTGPMFFWFSMAVRCVEAVGDAAFLTSSFAISAHAFPGRVATVVVRLSMITLCVTQIATIFL
jgi:MFS family permease